MKSPSQLGSVFVRGWRGGEPVPYRGVIGAVEVLTGRRNWGILGMKMHTLKIVEIKERTYEKSNWLCLLW